MAELQGALIGCGFFAVNQMHCWREVEGAGIVAICDRDPERLRLVGDQFGIARRYTDAAALFADGGFDFVDIATTVQSHQALASKGLVEISQGERAKVLRITAESIIRQVDLPAKLMLSGSEDSLEHLKSARIFFERGMVREAAARATPQHIAELEAVLERQVQNLGNADAFIEADMDFHQCIAKISGNPIYVAVSGAMLGWLKAYHSEMLIWTGRENFTLTEHEEIIRAIESGDAELAEQAMIKHLERSRALYALKNRK